MSGSFDVSKNTLDWTINTKSYNFPCYVLVTIAVGCISYWNQHGKDCILFKMLSLHRVLTSCSLTDIGLPKYTSGYRDMKARHTYWWFTLHIHWMEKLQHVQNSFSAFVLIFWPENTHLLRKGKYHCTADLLFDRLGFGQTSKSVYSFNSTKRLNPNQSNRRWAIQYIDISPYEVSECSLFGHSEVYV